MSWVKLTQAEDSKPVWVNMRTHDYMHVLVDDEAEATTLIFVHDGGHIEVVETPAEILKLLHSGG